MSSGNTRGWTWLDEATEEQVENVTLEAEIQVLADKWNELHNAMEYEQFTRDDDGFDDYLSDCDEDEAAAAIAKRNMARELKDAELAMIENKLAERNARIMRPYEQWGEEERYVEYMETRYDYGGDY